MLLKSYPSAPIAMFTFLLSPFLINGVCFAGWEHGEFYQRRDQSTKQLSNLQVSNGRTIQWMSVECVVNE